MGDQKFYELYANEGFQKELDYLETRMRLEILEIVRRFRLKGDVMFEIRRKSAASAYEKIVDVLRFSSAEFEGRKVHVNEILKDIIGARVICLHEGIQGHVFEYILQVESLTIDYDSIEYYSAAFREFTLAKDNHNYLSERARRAQDSLEANWGVDRKAKSSEYESLHFDVSFGSSIDAQLVRKLAAGGESPSNRRPGDIAEGRHMLELYESFNEEQKQALKSFPIEVQVRTITDHLWALEEHKYLYKNPNLSTDTGDNRKRMQVLKSTFTGLKYAYYNVDRLRTLARTASERSGDGRTVYDGLTKDINLARFAFFEDHVEEIYQEFKDAEQAFRGAQGQFMTGETDGVRVIDRMAKLYDRVVNYEGADPQIAGTYFNYEAWGRKRLFYLVFAYMALSAEDKRITDQVAAELKELVDLVDLVGDTAFRTSVQGSDGSLKLAAKLYERLYIFDRTAEDITRDMPELSNEKKGVFVDPLVSIRLASSFFLQNEFSGACGEIRKMLELGQDADDQILGWSRLPLAEGFKVADIVMRYSQYVFFESYEQEDLLLEGFLTLSEIFDGLFRLESVEFQPDLYRAYSWYYAVLQYQFTQPALVPQSLSRFKDQCREYLIKFHDDALADPIQERPEVRLSEIYLSIHLSNSDDVRQTIGDAAAAFQTCLDQLTAYPTNAKEHLRTMGFKLEVRAREKSGRRSGIVYVSYSARDDWLRNSVAQGLERNGLEVKYESSFEKGKGFVEGLTEKVRATLLTTNSAVLVVTPSYLDASDVARERAFLMDKRRRAELRLFVLLIDVSAQQLAEHLPLLAHRRGVSLHQTTEETLNGVLDELAKDITGGK